jgi:hypothetical protein
LYVLSIGAHSVRHKSQSKTGNDCLLPNRHGFCKIEEMGSRDAGTPPHPENSEALVVDVVKPRRGNPVEFASNARAIRHFQHSQVIEAIETPNLNVIDEVKLAYIEVTNSDVDIVAELVSLFAQQEYLP